MDPSHLIRMAVGVGFRRSRLHYAYMLLRGKNLKTGEITPSVREDNLEIFKNSLDVVTNLNNWYAFMNLFVTAGYLKGSFAASSNAVVFSYVLYLIGKYDYKVPSVDLQKIIRKWIFMSTITGFSTGSTETAVEKQHHIFPKHYLEQICYDNDRDRKQIANFTYLDYATNIDISDASPAEYVARYKKKLEEECYKLACAQNALPEKFEQLSYPDFLNQRRILIVQIVMKAYEKLCK